MPEPKVATFPAIRGALNFYRVAAIITGVMLLLLLIEMVLKYTPIHRELFLGGRGGIAWFAEVLVGAGCEWYSLFLPWQATCEMTSLGDGINVSLSILVAHGWLYVFYLFACFRLWSKMRWPFLRLVTLALGGVVPLLSFFMEVKVVREVRSYLAAREAAEAAGDSEAAEGQVLASSGPVAPTTDITPEETAR